MIEWLHFNLSTLRRVQGSGLSVKLVDPPAVGQVDWRGRINYFFIEKFGHSALQFVLILVVL